MNLPDLIGQLTTRHKAIAAAVAAVVVVAGVAGSWVALASSDSKPKSTPSPVALAPTTTASPTPKPTPKPTPRPKPRPALVNPLTGIGAPVKGPVVAVKINDTSVGAAQVGIDQADIVYIEQVEAGLTRLIAVYDTKKPIVGPVRSVRASDIELLSQYGAITIAASGGGGDSLPTLDRSILKSTINDRGGPGFFRDDNRQAPYNLMLNLAQTSGLGGAAAKSIGWTWARSAAGVAGARGGTSLQTQVGGTQVAFRWNTSLKRYLRYVGGSPQSAASGAPVATPNVIVQYCQGYTNYQDIDAVGNPGHYTKSIGRGRVSIFRNGIRIDGTWSRPTLASGTTFRDAKGHIIPLAPGGAWVVMTENGKPLTSG